MSALAALSRATSSCDWGWMWGPLGLAPQPAPAAAGLMPAL